MPIDYYIFYRGLSNISDYSNILAKNCHLIGDLKVDGSFNNTDSLMNANGYIKIYTGLIFQWVNLNSSSSYVYNDWGGYAYPITYPITMAHFLNGQITTRDHEPYTVFFSVLFFGRYANEPDDSLHAKFHDKLSPDTTTTSQGVILTNQAYVFFIGY